jgi:hypothetical protein
MELTEFRATLHEPAPPAALDPALAALWWLAKGDWDKAHESAQAQEDRRGAWVHAHLHRVEGDLSNAADWYRRAGLPAADGPLDAEWAGIAAALLIEPAADGAAKR